MVPHGTDTASYTKAVADPCDKPTALDLGMAFIVESYLPIRVAPAALYQENWRDMDYNECWQDGDGLTAVQFNGWDALLQSSQKPTSN
jgi:homogentisate 1,2-dioxygenase